MTLPTDDNRDLVVVVATMKSKAGKEQEVKDLLSSIVEPTRTEEGNVVYTLHQAADDPSTFIFYENWTSRDLLDAHLASPGLQEGLGALAPLLDGAPVIVPLHRIA